jgi:hypothetical protein
MSSALLAQLEFTKDASVEVKPPVNIPTEHYAQHQTPKVVVCDDETGRQMQSQPTTQRNEYPQHYATPQYPPQQYPQQQYLQQYPQQYQQQYQQHTVGHENQVCVPKRENAAPVKVQNQYIYNQSSDPRLAEQSKIMQEQLTLANHQLHVMSEQLKACQRENYSLLKAYNDLKDDFHVANNRMQGAVVEFEEIAKIATAAHSKYGNKPY